MKKIAIFASGSGTNAENIYKFFANGNRVSVPVLIYDRARAGVKERMEKYPDVKCIYMPGAVWKQNPDAILEILDREGIDLVVLAGFLRFVPDVLTRRYAGRMLNIHPSLLPAYGGEGMYGDKVHEAVIAAGERRSGVTVHYVSDKMDEGEILMQEEVEVSPDDTPASLAARIHAVEYSLYPRAIVAALARLNDSSAAASDDMSSTDNQAVVVEIEEEHPDAVNPPEIKGFTPPPMPSPAEEWAQTLGVDFDPDKVAPASVVIEDAPSANAYVTPSAPRDTAVQGNAPDGHQIQKMPPTNLVWAVLSTVLCCLPLGIVAIIFAAQVSGKFYTGDIDGAWRASRNAEIWIIISFVVGVMVNTLYIPLMMIV